MTTWAIKGLDAHVCVSLRSIGSWKKIIPNHCKNTFVHLSVQLNLAFYPTNTTELQKYICVPYHINWNSCARNLKFMKSFLRSDTYLKVFGSSNGLKLKSRTDNPISFCSKQDYWQRLYSWDHDLRPNKRDSRNFPI